MKKIPSAHSSILCLFLFLLLYFLSFQRNTCMGWGILVYLGIYKESFRLFSHDGGVFGHIFFFFFLKVEDL